MISFEAKSYLTPFDPFKGPVFWFNDVFAANSWSRPHVHPWGELAYVSHGSIVIGSANGFWLAPPQRAVWIPPFCLHEWYVPCHARDCSLWIDPNVFLSVERFGRCHMMQLSTLLREILLYLCPQQCSYGNDAIGRMVMTLIDQMLEQSEVTDPLTMPRDHRLVEMCTSILTRPGDAITLAEWAGRLGMSERNLARLFRRETGMSFRSWRRQQRMHSAHSRLKQGENVTTVAIDCGYSSVSAFIAAFRQVFGITPGNVDYSNHQL